MSEKPTSSAMMMMMFGRVGAARAPTAASSRAGTENFRVFMG
jgi:hypothetical protein